MFRVDKNKNQVSQAGFTYMELVVVLSIFALVFTLGADVYLNLTVDVDIKQSAYRVLGDMRRARSFSVGGAGNYSYGVNIDNTTKKVTLYKGNSYATRVTSDDQVLDLDPSIIVSLPGASKDFHFTKFTGFPSQTGNIYFTGPMIGTSTINVNSFGVMDIDL